jgi:hypothetical protein
MNYKFKLYSLILLEELNYYFATSSYTLNAALIYII